MADISSAWQSRANVPQGDPNVIHMHKELHDHDQAIAELTATMNQLAKAQLQQVQGPNQVNAMEGVNMMINKRRQREVQHVNNYQGQRGNAPNQQQWRSQGNWGNQGQQGNWNSGNNNNQSNWGNNNNQNWDNQGNQGNWGGNNNSNWGGNNNQGGWNNDNQGNRGSGFQRPPMYQQLNNPPLFPSQGPSSSNNEMGRIESMFEQMMKKNANSDAQLDSHNTSIRNLEVQHGQISQALNTRPKGALPSDSVVNPKGGNNMGHAMAVTTRSGRGGVASISNPRKLVSDNVMAQDDDESNNDVQVNDENVNDEVRIDINDNREET
ncbi:uncharacterized protein [Nicotiana sylvestris]|uniref:uncharacterized protein n=1 Tax=Nicotiana sylvestris TaxID=4096 RepID=UPI00388C59C6